MNGERMMNLTSQICEEIQFLQLAILDVIVEISDPIW
jgi:hypothetical protein